MIKLILFLITIYLLQLIYFSCFNEDIRCKLLTSLYLLNYVVYSKFPIFYDNVNSLLIFIRNLGIFRILKKVLLFILAILALIISFIRIVLDMVTYLHTYRRKVLYLVIIVLIIIPSLYSIIYINPIDPLLSINLFVKTGLNLLNLLSKINTGIGKLIEYLIIKLSNKDRVRLIGKDINNARYRIFTYSNEGLLDPKEACKSIYENLMNDQDFLNFGQNKIIVITAVCQEYRYNFHPNINITNNTTFNKYYSNIRKYIDKHYTDTNSFIYYNNIIPVFSVKIWNVDLIKNKNIKRNSIDSIRSYSTTVRTYSTKTKGTMPSPITEAEIDINNKIECSKYDGFITPYLKKESDSVNKIIKLAKGPKVFGTMDIETINIDNKQIPIAISSCYKSTKVKLFLIDRRIFKINKDKAVIKLFKEYFSYIAKLPEHTIFVHNLGSFDGYFIFKYLVLIYENDMVDTIIDDSNKFIQISLLLNKPTPDQKTIEKLKYTYWRDSYRIFPISLNQLSEVFGGTPKLSKYNPKFNSIDLFEDKELFELFKEYAKTDAISLYESIDYAKSDYLEKYNVDLSNTVSTSSLSLRIFRSEYLNTNIPILKGLDDFFIRKSYIGGATDYYKLYGQNLHYYDVNSLYPYAMLNPIPLKLIKIHKDLTNFDLNDFFGFALAEIYCPNSIKNPVLPYKDEMTGKTIYPRGNWRGVYFSEELKAVKALGYEIKLLTGYEFSKFDLFSNYISHFYAMKRDSIGSSRFIAKMHLNTLYGIFGRKKDIIETKIVNNDELDDYLLNRSVKSIIDLNDKSILLLQNNLPTSLIELMSEYVDKEIKSYRNTVNSNVAVASAITSYARIHMIQYKLDGHIFYTDTDSIFTDTPLNINFIGKDLGLMKDELDGLLIKEAYFLDIKKYGYWYLDKKGNRVEKSTIAGVPRNSVSFKEIESLVKGSTLTREINNMFYHDFTKLDK